MAVGMSYCLYNMMFFDRNKHADRHWTYKDACNICKPATARGKAYLWLTQDSVPRCQGWVDGRRMLEPAAEV